MGSVHVRLGVELSRWWSAVSSVTSSDDGRPVLTGVYVECGDVWSPVFGDFVGVTLTATDSYRLVTVGVPLAGGYPSDDGPAWNGEPGRVLVPGRAVKIPARGALRLTWEDDGAGELDPVEVHLSVRKGETSSVTTVSSIGGHFPNYRNLMPADGDLGRCEPVAVNPVYLGQILTAFGKAGGSDRPVRYVSQPSDMKPGRWDMMGPDNEYAASAILMPVRVPESGGSLGGPLGHLPMMARDDSEAVAS